LKTYAAIFTFVPDILERRPPYREAHLKHFYALRDAGKIILAGPWANPYDGALVVFRAESPDEVERLIQEDAYYQAHLWTNILIREWDLVIVTDVSAVITPKVP
jgi:uncharacterized protein YciI